MDFIKEVAGLSAEQITALTAGHTKAVENLEANKGDILGEKKALQTSLSNLQAEFDGHKNSTVEAEENAKIELAKKANNIEELTKILGERDKRINEQAADSKKAADSAIKQAARTDFLSKVATDAASQLYMASQFDSGAEVRDGVVVNVKDGNLTGVSMNDFNTGLLSSDANKNYVVANVGSGGSANGSESSGSAAKTLSRADLPSDPMARSQKFQQMKRDGIKLID